MIGGVIFSKQVVQPIYKKVVMITESGIFSLGKARFDNFKSSYKGFWGETFFHAGSPQYYFLIRYWYHSSSAPHHFTHGLNDDFQIKPDTEVF